MQSNPQPLPSSAPSPSAPRGGRCASPARFHASLHAAAGAGQRELNKGVALGGARGVADHEAALQGAVRDASGAQPGVGAVLAARVGQEEADLQER